MLCRCSGNPTAGRSRPRPRTRRTARLQEGVRAERSSPRGASERLPAAAAPSSTGGDAGALLRTGSRGCLPVPAPASRPPRPPPNPPSESRALPLLSPALSSGPEGPGVVSPSQAGRAGAAPAPQLGVEPASSASVGAAVCRCCPDSCCSHPLLGVTNASVSTQIP